MSESTYVRMRDTIPRQTDIAEPRTRREESRELAYLSVEKIVRVVSQKSPLAADLKPSTIVPIASSSAESMPANC